MHRCINDQNPLLCSTENYGMTNDYTLIDRKSGKKTDPLYRYVPIVMTHSDYKILYGILRSRLCCDFDQFPNR